MDGAGEVRDDGQGDRIGRGKGNYRTKWEIATKTHQQGNTVKTLKVKKGALKLMQGAPRCHSWDPKQRDRIGVAGKDSADQAPAVRGEPLEGQGGCWSVREGRAFSDHGRETSAVCQKEQQKHCFKTTHSTARSEVTRKKGHGTAEGRADPPARQCHQRRFINPH